MSNHLRHCPKHRKPLPCAHCALTVASPTPVVVTPEPVPVTTTESLKKRGRPAKHGVAMTSKERVAQHRLDKERRDLVAQLLVIFKRMLPFADQKSPQADAVLAERRLRLRRIRDEWVLLPVDELQKVLALYKAEKDSRGRLSGESSGEADRKSGMSGTEQRIAKADGEQHTGYDDDSASVPSNYNTEPDGSSTRPPQGLRIPQEHIDYLDRREGIITELIDEHVRKISLDDDQPVHRCVLCLAELPDRSCARQHFWEEYDKGLRMFYRFKELSENPGVVALAPFIVNDARKSYQEHKHLQAVWTKSRLWSKSGK